ncbi:MAG: hypothetical protein SNF33_06760 [Candidatus Algichlamydia australiensis]|nr:hypothetical protein [Chlamydiales bacterium]
MAALSHGIGLCGAVVLTGQIESNITKPPQQTEMRVRLLFASILATAASGWASPPSLRVPVLLYTIATIFPAIAWKYNRDVNRKGEDQKLRGIGGIRSRITQQNSRDFDNEVNFIILYGLALPIIGAVGLSLANIHLFKSTLPLLRKMGLPRNLCSAKEYRPLLPAVRGFVKFSSGFAIGQGLGALFWRIFIKDVNKTESREDKRVRFWSRTFANLGLLAGTVALFIGYGNLGKYKSIIPIIASVGLGFAWLKTEGDQLRSSILPVDITDKYRVLSLVGVGAAGLYLGTHPKVNTLFQLIVKG